MEKRPFQISYQESTIHSNFWTFIRQKWIGMGISAVLWMNSLFIGQAFRDLGAWPRERICRWVLYTCEWSHGWIHSLIQRTQIENERNVSNESILESCLSSLWTAPQNGTTPTSQNLWFRECCPDISRRSERIDDQQTIREGLMVSLENWFGESERLTVYSRIILWVQPPVKESIAQINWINLWERNLKALPEIPQMVNPLRF